MQDALLGIIRNVSHYAVSVTTDSASTADSGNLRDLLRRVHSWTLAAAFSTLTNVNFSSERIATFCREGLSLEQELIQASPTRTKPDIVDKVVAMPSLDSTVDDFEEYGKLVSIPTRERTMDHADAFSLNELATYGLKGACAYARHVEALLDDDFPVDVMNEIQEMWSIIDNPTADMDLLLKTVFRVGEVNAKIMAMLDQAHADKFGTPEPTQIRMTEVEGKCILVSGHDVGDLYELLKQTEGKEINVYTHGEMLPAHTYPKLKAFSHLVGNYGTAWQNQKSEFAAFPGPVIVTTNCIVEPSRLYKDRLFTMNEVGFDGVTHIGHDRDYSGVIETALSNKGFKKTIEPPRYHLAGFNHRVIVDGGVANLIVDAAKAGKLSRVFLIGGCDGSQSERSYFTDLAEATPDDSMILTLGCAKNRIIHSRKLHGATIGDTGLPRVVDMGQCNDSYSAVVVAMELAKILQAGSVNDLPLSLAISHLEQKAAAVLCTLLHLGIRNIRLGPSLPAFLTPNVLNLLTETFNLQPVGDYNSDLKSMMESK